MKFKYPKLSAFILAVILAYVAFRNPAISEFISHLDKLAYFGSFISGILYSFGFTAPFATGFFIELNPDKIVLTAIIAGLGSVIADLTIFSLIRFSFMDEFESIKHSKTSNSLNKLMGVIFSEKIKKYVLYILAFFIIASPLPDEAGIVLFAGLTKISKTAIAVLGFVLNTAGIFILLSL